MALGAPRYDRVSARLGLNRNTSVPRGTLFHKKPPCSHCGRPVIVGRACKQPDYGLMVCTPVAVKEANLLAVVVTAVKSSSSSGGVKANKTLNNTVIGPVRAAPRDSTSEPSTSDSLFTGKAKNTPNNRVIGGVLIFHQLGFGVFECV